MLARYWAADETASLVQEKRDTDRFNTRLDELTNKEESLTIEEEAEKRQLLGDIQPDFPPLPASWAGKYEQVLGRPLEISKPQRRKRSGQAIDFNRSLTSPAADIEIKREPEMFDKADIEMFDQEGFDRLRHHSDYGNEQNSHHHVRHDSGPFGGRKELRVSLTNVMEHPQVKKDLAETGSIISNQSRPSSGLMSPDLASPDQNGIFVGLKFARSHSGRWSASLKRDILSDEDEGEITNEFDRLVHMQAKRLKDSRTLREKSESPGSQSDESEDEEFSLADVGGNNPAVRSMLENDDMEEDDDDMQDELRFDNQSRISFDRFDTSHLRFGSEGGGLYSASPHLGSETGGGDTDSVQNAINSILDLHDRGGVQTPDDLNNLTGLLDRMEQTEDTTSIDAAVNSIL